MRDLLLRIWTLPWPQGLRWWVTAVLRLPVIRVVAFPHFMVGVVGIIRDREGNILMLRHTYRGRYPWGLPTGFVEHGEQPREALLREVREETGFDISLGETPYIYTLPDYPLMNVVYVGEYLGGEFRPSMEVAEARFVAPADVPPLGPASAWLRELLTA